MAGLERLYEMLDMAVEMGGEYFIFHPGRLAFYSISTHRVIFMEQKIPGRHIELFSDSVKRLLDYAGDRIKLCIENTHTLPQQFLDRIARMAIEDRLNLVWDVGHTELAPAAKRERIIKFFQENIRRVKLGHLHDVFNGADHKALGTGEVNIAGYLEIFDTIGADVILEVFPETDLLKSVEYIKQLESVYKPK
jgi:sugar phosphate isomerase/epimerase